MKKRLLIFIVFMLPVAAAPATLAQPAASPRAEKPPVKAIDAPLQVIGAIAPAGGYSLRDLLRAGYDIIHVDAPVGTTAARFILRKDDKVYSCAITTYRDGSDASAAMRVIAAQCLDLTP